MPTIGGQITSGEPVMTGGAFHQHPDDRTYGATPPHLPLESRPDVLVFQTAPLAEDLAIAGPVSVHLAISSTATDTDFTVKLIDVHPPSADYPHGFAMNLTDGILRCRYRNSFSEPEPLVPGQVHDIVIDAPDTANLFLAGHRLRLDISSSNFPRFDVNTNTGAPEVGDAAKWSPPTGSTSTAGRGWSSRCYHSRRRYSIVAESLSSCHPDHPLRTSISSGPPDLADEKLHSGRGSGGDEH